MSAECRSRCSCNAGDVRVPRAPSRVAAVNELSAEQQVFVLYQIRNWVFGHYGAFRLLNDAWAPRGAEAYFWN